MRLSHYVPFTWIRPASYTEQTEKFADLDVEWWSEEFTWEQDPWNGFKDFLTDPETVLEQQSGDCEDYAFVILSWAKANDKECQMGLLFEGWNPYPRHTVAVVDGNVYSSGSIYKDTSMEGYVADSEYDRYTLIEV